MAILIFLSSDLPRIYFNSLIIGQNEKIKSRKKY